jgi:hypothetical protein
MDLVVTLLGQALSLNGKDGAKKALTSSEMASMIRS